MYNLIYNTTFSNNILQTLGPLPIYVLIFAIIYFVMIRPQAKKQKEHNQMLDNLKKEKLSLMYEINDLDFKNSLLSDNLDLDYIETLIRERFIFGKKNEKIYILSTNEN